MTPENPKLTAYFNLLKCAEDQAFWASVDGFFMGGLALSIVHATLETVAAGLTPAEMKAAVQIGEWRGSPQETYQDPDTLATYRQPDYRQRVEQEAAAFWLRRYRGVEE